MRASDFSASHPESESERQRSYYAQTAARYDAMHVADGDEHHFALCFLLGALQYLGIRSVLDVGSGTGRVISFIKKHNPEIRIAGIEPVPELRAIGHAKGLSRAELFGGDATAMDFADDEFDLVCEFGVLHHIRDSGKAVGEMLRVARKAVFISDSNNFGHGSAAARLMKQVINAMGLWRAADFVKTRGAGYSISEGDGIAYSYSVFNNYQAIRRRCAAVHILNTTDAGRNLYRSASHVALLGVKPPPRDRVVSA